MGKKELLPSHTRITTEQPEVLYTVGVDSERSLKYVHLRSRVGSLLTGSLYSSPVTQQFHS